MIKRMSFILKRKKGKFLLLLGLLGNSKLDERRLEHISGINKDFYVLTIIVIVGFYVQYAEFFKELLQRFIDVLNL